MSKTILSEVDGFTPLPDVLVERYGILTAAIFGRAWRYCQMQDGVCRASLERIACGLNISRMSVMRHIRMLVTGGYLQDITPDRRNRPHVYADTGKISVDNRLEMAARGGTESDSPGRAGVTQSSGTVTLSDSHCNTELLEDSVNRPLKKATTITTSGEIFKIYEQEIGPLTPIISQEMQGYLDDPQCPSGYIADAIREAARQNKRNWAYIRAILQRWKVEGKQVRGKPPPREKDSQSDNPAYRRYVDPQEEQYVSR